MHFALPPKKSSQPPPFARANVRSKYATRTRTLQLISYAVLAILTVYLLFHYLSASSSPSEPPEPIPPNPEILIVTLLDPSTMSSSYINMITTNRNDYASRHNYNTFYTNTSLYTHLTYPSPSSWTLVPALRHALKLHPAVNYIWSLTPHALITTPSLSLHSHILANLSSLMQKDIPVVPPDSVIHTYAHLAPTSAHIILSQDMDNIAHTSLLLKNTPSTPHSHPSSSACEDEGFLPFLLDTWFDPLYRAYAFHLADLHALEHLIQWHPTITSKLAIIPQRILNAYNFAYPPRKVAKPSDSTTGVNGEDAKEEVLLHDSMWAEGDLLVNFKGCADAKERDCESEMLAYWKRWEKEVAKLDALENRTEAAVDQGKSPVDQGG